MGIYNRWEKDQNWQQIEELNKIKPDFVFITIDNAERLWAPKEVIFHYYELVYIFSGELVMWLQGKPIKGVKDDLFIVKPRVRHREESPRGSFSQLLCLATKFKQKSSQECEFPLELSQKIQVGDNQLLIRNFRAIANEAYYRKTGYAEAISSYIMQIFLEIARLTHKMTIPKLDISDIRRNLLGSEARKFIKENYASNPSLEDIAQHFFMSPFHFARIFKQVNKISAISYLTKVRIENGKHLLLDPQMTIKAVAAEIGYNDQHYFSKVFTRNEGLTPTEYRRENSIPI